MPLDDVQLNVGDEQRNCFMPCMSSRPEVPRVVANSPETARVSVTPNSGSLIDMMEISGVGDIMQWDAPVEETTVHRSFDTRRFTHFTYFVAQGFGSIATELPIARVSVSVRGRRLG